MLWLHAPSFYFPAPPGHACLWHQTCPWLTRILYVNSCAYPIKSLLFQLQTGSRHALCFLAQPEHFDETLTLHVHMLIPCLPHPAVTRISKMSVGKDFCYLPFRSKISTVSLSFRKFLCFKAHSQTDHCSKLAWPHALHKPEDFSGSGTIVYI